MGFVRAFSLSALLPVSFLASGCHCDCDPALEIVLPTLDARVEQAVRVDFRRGDAAEPWLICDWGKPETGGNATWACDPKAKTVQADSFSSRFRFEDTDVKSELSIGLEGPTGSESLKRTPNDTDPGEGYPGSCVCYSHDVVLSAQELLAVGAK
jgi:hypothetical protein